MIGMNYFRRRLFGYSMNEVERYFADLESEHGAFVSQKQSELNLIKEKIDQLTTENNNLTQELDALNKTKESLINYTNDKIHEMESFVDNKQAESKEVRQQAIEKLMKKREELVEIQNCTIELKKDLSYIKYRLRQGEKIFSQ